MVRNGILVVDFNLSLVQLDVKAHTSSFKKIVLLLNTMFGSGKCVALVI